MIEMIHDEKLVRTFTDWLKARSALIYYAAANSGKIYIHNRDKGETLEASHAAKDPDQNPQ